MGHYIWIEGSDGTGKTTLCKALSEKIADAIVIAFPSRATAPGALIRDVFEGKLQVHPQAMMWLFVADGVDMEPKVLQWLSEGKTVIVDRHTYVSGLVYQTDLHSKQEVMQTHAPAHFRMPDRAYFLDIDPRGALARMGRRGEALNVLYESADISKLAARRTKYLYVAGDMGSKARVIAAEAPVEETVQFIMKDLGIGAA